MKLRTSIFLWVTLIAILPQIILTSVLLGMHVNSTNERMTEIIEHQFDNIKRSVISANDEVKRALGILTFYSEDSRSLVRILEKFSDPDKPLSDYEVYKASSDIKSIAQSTCYVYKFLNAVYVFLPSGSLFSHTPVQQDIISNDYNPIREQWYKDTIALDGRVYIGSLSDHAMINSATENIFVAQAITDIHTRKPLGIIFLECMPSLYNLDAVNALGNMVCITLKYTESDTVLYSNIDDINFNPQNERNRMMNATLTDSGLSLTMVFDNESLFKDMRDSAAALLTICILCECLIIVMAYRISSSIIKPITMLSAHVSGQWTTPFIPFLKYENRKNEVGTLIRAYNDMTEQLNTAIKEKYENNLLILDSQMKALEASINSHFLFNTLESINSMAVLADNEPIATMSHALGRMFRYAIKTEHEQVTLREEIQNVLDYADIQHIRFDGCFQLRIDISDVLYEKRVLKLILQPIVENALIHGLNYCTEGNEVIIQAFVDSKLLVIRVLDNGRGMSVEQLATIQSALNEEASFREIGHRTKESIGLKNIHSRIVLYYGKAYGITIKSDEDVGTAIEIRIPILS